MQTNQNQTSVRQSRSAWSVYISLILLLLSSPGLLAQTATLAPSAKFTGFDDNGDPISSGKLCTYTAGTTTPATTYTDSALAVANTNPVVLDAAGRGDVWLTTGTVYKFVLRTAGSDATCATGTVVWTVDNIGAVPTTSNNLDILGTAGEAITAGYVVYLSDGSGGKTAGQWYLADADLAYASGLPILGMAPSAIASGVAGTIRLQGIVTGLSSLTVGTTYYVSATAGTLAGTVPVAHRRVVGVADTTSSLVLNANPNVPLSDIGLCQGRLSLTTGVPFTTADVTAATTLYFVPYNGNHCALYDGTHWLPRTFTELSITVPATTGQMYDVFLYDTLGVMTLELNAWTNDTTPATAHTGATFYQDGVPIKAGTSTRRYLGSFRTASVSGQTEDSAANRLVWNYYNRLPRTVRVLEATNSWTYSTNTFRCANTAGACVNQAGLVVGVVGPRVQVSLAVNVTDSNTSDTAYVAIGEDSTTTPASASRMNPVTNPVAGSVWFVPTAQLEKYPAIGYHFYAWLEKASGVGTTTWYGDNGAATDVQGGLMGWIEG